MTQLTQPFRREPPVAEPGRTWRGQNGIGQRSSGGASGEVPIGHGVRREETLCLLRRLEALHLPSAAGVNLPPFSISRSPAA
jgi:hypothetical protein